MSELKDVINSYNSLSFSDRIVFYTTISNDIQLTDDTQTFLIETRFDGGPSLLFTVFSRKIARLFVVQFSVKKP